MGLDDIVEVATFARKLEPPPALRHRRIAIAGASGTGKTRLVHLLADHYDLEVCPVGSRSVAKEMGFDNPYETDRHPELRARFQRLLFERKREWEVGRACFVTDRTHLDNLAYTSMHGAHGLAEGALDEYATAMCVYTAVFYCPVAAFQRLGGDPHRRPELVYHQLYDVILEGMLRRFRPDYRTLGCPVDERFAQVVAALG